MGFDLSCSTHNAATKAKISGCGGFPVTAVDVNGKGRPDSTFKTKDAGARSRNLLPICAVIVVLYLTFTFIGILPSITWVGTKYATNPDSMIKLPEDSDAEVRNRVNVSTPFTDFTTGTSFPVGTNTATTTSTSNALSSTPSTDLEATERQQEDAVSSAGNPVLNLTSPSNITTNITFSSVEDAKRVVSGHLWRKLVVPLSQDDTSLTVQSIVAELLAFDIDGNGFVSHTEMAKTYRRCTRPTYELKKIAKLTELISDTLIKEPGCEFVGCYGTAIGLSRGRLIPWERDGDFCISERTERECLRALERLPLMWNSTYVKRIDFKGGEEGKLVFAHKWHYKPSYMTKYKVYLVSETGEILRMDVMVYRRVPNSDGSTSLMLVCGPDHPEVFPDCSVSIPEGVVFPAISAQLKEGFSGLMPRNMPAYMALNYNTPENVHRGRSGKGGFCFDHRPAVQWVQDYLLDGFWDWMAAPLDDEDYRWPDYLL